MFFQLLAIGDLLSIFILKEPLIIMKRMCFLHKIMIHLGCRCWGEVGQGEVRISIGLDLTPKIKIMKFMGMGI